MLFASLLALPLLATGSLAAILNRDFAIQGCVGVTTVLNVAGGLGTTLLLGLYQTEGDCVNACAARGNQYAYFRGGQVLSTVTSCACSNTPPGINQLIAATAAVDGALTGGICGTAGFEAISITSDLQLRACAYADAFTNTATGPTTNNIGTADACLRSCSAFAYAIVNLAVNNGACTCASGTNIVNSARLGACSRTGASNAIYFNTLFPLASRTARKRDIFARDQVPLGLCPNGLQACLLGDNASSTANDAFECIDTKSELESCGGCIHGLADSLTGASSSGIDCSSLPGVALGGSTCTWGKCEIYACKKGYSLVDGRCQPRK